MLKNIKYLMLNYALIGTIIAGDQAKLELDTQDTLAEFVSSEAAVFIDAKSDAETKTKLVDLIMEHNQLDRQAAEIYVDKCIKLHIDHSFTKFKIAYLRSLNRIHTAKFDNLSAEDCQKYAEGLESLISKVTRTKCLDSDPNLNDYKKRLRRKAVSAYAEYLLLLQTRPEIMFIIDGYDNKPSIDLLHALDELATNNQDKTK